jgi:ribosomal protein S18 acetylase RimI-like enzyme
MPGTMSGMNSDVENIERGTLAAIPPDPLFERAGWLLGLDAGTVGRAHSAVPLQHTQPDAAVIPMICERYAAQGLAPVFRIPDVQAFDGFAQVLSAAGFKADRPTLTMVSPVAQVQAGPHPGDGVQVEWLDQPDDDWAAVFLGEGFDPVDGAHRVRLLRRSNCTAYARVREQGVTVAVGSACFSHGWVGVHGMRTAQAARGRGMASAILGDMARLAADRGLDRMFLQVEAANVRAQALYARGGFALAWQYRYWAGGPA